MVNENLGIMQEVASMLSFNTFFNIVTKATCKICNDEMELDEMIEHFSGHTAEETNVILKSTLDQYRKEKGAGN